MNSVESVAADAGIVIVPMSVARLHHRKDVVAVPVSGVPTTKDVIGYYVGQPKKLTHTADIGRYYRALAAASERVKVIPVGTTDEGRECLVTVISDEENIRNLDTYKGYLARLADPRGLSADSRDCRYRWRLRANVAESPSFDQFHRDEMP